MLLSVAFQQLYQMTDSMIVGRFALTPEAGELALAAVGASYPITQLFVAVATGVNIGTSVLVSQLFGAKRYLRMKTAISTALITTAAIALLLTLVGTLGTHGIMSALQTPANIFADGALYLRVYVFGLLFLFLYNVCTGIFNAMGDSRTPLILLIISSVSNVILDLIFVAVFHWDVAGVAWATFIAQGASGVLAFLLLLRRVRSFDTRGHFLLFSPEMLRRLTNYAVPSIAQQSFVSVGNVIIQYYVNLCGATVIAGYSAATKVNMFALTCCMSFASGLSSYVAQNIGARKLDRIGRDVLGRPCGRVHGDLPAVLGQAGRPVRARGQRLGRDRRGAAVPVHPRAVLHHRVPQIRVRQRAARRGRDAAVYDHDLFRPDPARGLLDHPVPVLAGARHLDLLAARLVPRLGPVDLVLPAGRVEEKPAPAVKRRF